MINQALVLIIWTTVYVEQQMKQMKMLRLIISFATAFERQKKKDKEHRIYEKWSNIDVVRIKNVFETAKEQHPCRTSCMGCAEEFGENDTSLTCNNIACVNISCTVYSWILFWVWIKYINNNNVPTKCDSRRSSAVVTAYCRVCWIEMFVGVTRCWFDITKRMEPCNMNMIRWHIESFVESTALIRSSKASMLNE